MLGGIIASDIFLPALPAVAKNLGAEVNQVKLTITLFFLGYGLAQFFSGIITSYLGNRRSVWLSIIIFILSSIGCALSQHISTLITARLLQAMSGGLIAAIGRASIVDIFKENAKNAFLIIMPIVSASPGIAPILGGFITHWISWRASFVVVILIALIASSLINREIHTSNSMNSQQILTGYKSIIKNRSFWLACLIIIGCNMSYFIYITNSPFLLHNFQLTTKQIGLCYFPITVGFILASQITRLALKKVSQNTILVCGTLLFILSLFALHVLSATITLWQLLLLMSIFSAGLGCLMPIAIHQCVAAIPSLSHLTSSLAGFFIYLSATLGSQLTYYYATITVQHTATLMTWTIITTVLAYSGLVYYSRKSDSV